MRQQAERFATMADAKRRWEVLEMRLSDHPQTEGVVVTAFLDGQPYVLCLLLDAPPDMFAGPHGAVDPDVDDRVWLALALRHDEKMRRRRGARDVTRRAPQDGIRVLPPSPPGL